MNQYIVQLGDTIYSIARMHSLTTRELLAANAGIMERELLPGETIQLPPPQDCQTIEINGYAAPNTDEKLYGQILPYLTYLGIVGNRITLPGQLVSIHNAEMIQDAWEANVGPVMVVSNTSENGIYSSDLVHAVLSNPAATQRLIDDIVEAVRENNYYGANIDFMFISPHILPAYIRFLQTLRDALHAQGYQLFVVVRIIVLLSEQENISLLLPLPEFQNVADRFLIRTNEWACNVNLEVSLLDLTQQAIDFATQLVPAWKIIIGIPNCCFQSPLPYQPQISPTLLSIAEAEDLSVRAGASFQTDSRSGLSYFLYTDSEGRENIVWCPNRCVNMSILELVRIYDLGGVSFRMIEDFSIMDYQALNAMFNIQKVI